MSLLQVSRHSTQRLQSLCSTKKTIDHHTITSVKLASSTKKTLSSSAPFHRPSTDPRFSPAIDRSKQLLNHLSTKPTFTTQTSTMTSLPISEKGYSSKAASVYTARKVGAANTLEHRIYVEKDGVPCSPFHDIPLYANEQQTVLNMIVEVPRWTNAKMEVCYMINVEASIVLNV